MNQEKKQRIIQEINYMHNYYSFDLSVIDKLDSYLNQANDTIESIIVKYFSLVIDDKGLMKSFEANNIYDNSIRDKFFNYITKDKKPLIFLDVDNTLTLNGVLSVEKINYLKSFVNKENIILSTGKIYNSIKNVIDECELNNAYSSTLNGAVLVHNNKLKIINSLGSISESICNEIKKTNLNAIAYYSQEIVPITKLLEKNYNDLKKYNEMYLTDNLAIDYKKVIKVLAFIDDDNKQSSIDSAKIMDEIAERYHMKSLRTAYHTYEIVNPLVDKGTSLKLICEKLNYYYKATIAVGDSMNDFDMLNYAGLPYVVSNQSNELAKYNFNVLPGNRDNDIVLLIKKYYE